jgi:hypothetical protein
MAGAGLPRRNARVMDFSGINLLALRKNGIYVYNIMKHGCFNDTDYF